MIDIFKLQAEHREILQTAGRLSDILRQCSAPPLIELFELRTKLTSSLIKHLKSEDWVLYPALLKSRDEKTANVAQKLKTEAGDFSEIYAQHCHRWPTVAIAANWDLYREASLKLLKCLGRRIELEEQELYPLVAACVSPDMLFSTPTYSPPIRPHHSSF